MTDNVYLNADRTKVVNEWTVGKKWQVPRKVAVEMGLLDSPEKPVQERRGPQKRRKPKSE
jgi:hypothetical protein